MWISTPTRPDVANAVRAACGILEYLDATTHISIGLTYRREDDNIVLGMDACVDATHVQSE